MADNTEGQDEDQEDDEMDLLFELCKEDFPLTSDPGQLTVSMGAFLRDLERTGIRRDDARIQALVRNLTRLVAEDRVASNIDNIKLNKHAFKR